MYYTDNPLSDFARHDAEQQADVDKLPKCSECGYPIQEEHCFEVNGEYICEKCLNDNHRVFTEDVI